jgi:hypothetical protein
MKNLLLAATILLCQCARSPSASQLNEGNSIVFPKFYEYAPVKINRPGEFYHIDGATLVALSIAANDFAPRNRDDIPCWDRQEAFHYQFTRQNDVVFIRIEHNPNYCKHNFLIMDGGAQYAISLDGRILRRVFDGEPMGPLPFSDAGSQDSAGLQSIPEINPGEPDPSFLERLRKKAESMRPDSGPPLPEAPDGGLPAPLDGGPPAETDGGV